MVHPEFFALVQTFNSHDLSVIMRSNGQLIDAVIADQIAAMDFRFVGISIDGGSQCTNDMIRGEGAYERAIEAIRLLKARGLCVTIEVALTSKSIGEIPQIVSTADQLEVDMVIFRRFIPLGFGAGRTELCIATGDSMAAADRIGELANCTSVHLAVGCNLGAICPAYDYISIDVKGWVHPCYMVRKPLFHVSDLEREGRAKLLEYRGLNAHQCLT